MMMLNNTLQNGGSYNTSNYQSHLKHPVSNSSNFQSFNSGGGSNLNSNGSVGLRPAPTHNGGLSQIQLNYQAQINKSKINSPPKMTQEISNQDQIQQLQIQLIQNIQQRQQPILTSNNGLRPPMLPNTDLNVQLSQLGQQAKNQISDLNQTQSFQIQKPDINQQLRQDEQVSPIKRLLSLKAHLETFQGQQQPKEPSFKPQNDLQEQLKQHILKKRGNVASDDSHSSNEGDKKRDQKFASKQPPKPKDPRLKFQASPPVLTKRPMQQYIDHSSEKYPARAVETSEQKKQKKRRLHTASFKQNQIFHSSGNRFVPVMPQCILGNTYGPKQDKKI